METGKGGKREENAGEEEEKMAEKRTAKDGNSSQAVVECLEKLRLEEEEGGKWYLGTCRWFNPHKGWGFINLRKYNQYAVNDILYSLRRH